MIPGETVHQRGSSAGVRMSPSDTSALWPSVPFLAVAQVQKGRQPERLFGDARRPDALPYLSIEFLRTDGQGPQDFVEPKAGLVIADEDDTILVWAGNAGEFVRARRGVVSSTSALVSSPALDRNYLYYVCKAVLEPQLRALAVGAVIPSVDPQVLKTIRIPLPSPGEQKRIGEFLRHAEDILKAATQQQRRLVALLLEARQAEAHWAVTKGLNPRAEVVPTGVDWLGDIPAHWTTVHLGELVQERRETNGNLAVKDVLSLLRHRGVIPYGEKGNIGNKMSDDISRYKVVRKGDLVLNSMNVMIGSVGISELEGCLSPVYYVLMPRGEVSVEYVNGVFQSPAFHRSLRRIGKGILAHRLRVPMEMLKREVFPRPPLEEQRAIARYLRSRRSELGEILERAQRQSGLLEELQARLTADVVLGAMDLRSAAALIPETLAHTVLGGRIEHERTLEMDTGEATDLEDDALMVEEEI